MDKNIHIVLGTKAQLIKMAPIMSLLQEKKIPYNFIFTGQHKETMDKMLDSFGLKRPDVILYSGRDITSVVQMAIWVLRIVIKTLKNKKSIFGKGKGVVLVHGDTFSTLLGALMGKVSGQKVAHIESGLRSFNIFHPFPEELTRIFTFKLTDYYFCPGQWAIENLKKEKGEKIDTLNNTLLDSLEAALKAKNKIEIEIPKEKYCICTIHRFENIFNKEQLKIIVDYVNDVSKKIKVLFILHIPTEERLKKFGFFDILKDNKNIELRPRYDYFEFTKLSETCEFLISDGGSNQEEAYYMGKPILLFRKKTERQEGLGENAVLSCFDKKIILEFLENYKKFKKEKVRQEKSPSEIIVRKISEITNRKEKTVE